MDSVTVLSVSWTKEIQVFKDFSEAVSEAFRVVGAKFQEEFAAGKLPPLSKPQMIRNTIVSCEWWIPGGHTAMIQTVPVQGT